MFYEKSCGAIVYTWIKGKPQYVIVKSLEGIYGFPKGHVEKNETEAETALREIYEEVGLHPALIDGFRVTDEYPIPGKPDVTKQVVFFLAEYDNQELRYQKEELLGAELMEFDKAMNSFQFESSKKILSEANDFLNK